jgi:cell division protein FtsL
MSLLGRDQALAFWRSGRFPGDRYLQVVTLILIIIAVASFYIYQRVWVRSLVEEIDQLRELNKTTEEKTAILRVEWMAASSIANTESAAEGMNLGLAPTRPSQNFVIQPEVEWEKDRYAGLAKAWEKLRGSIPLVKTNEAQAGQLFQGQGK